MKKISETIVFFGSGPVAAKSLELLADNFDIEAVVTKPRPDHHKGDVPVLAIAERLSLPVFTAGNKQVLDELFSSSFFMSHLGVLIDFGIIVSQSVIDYFPLGIVNSHFSVLPEWRGADPITFAILSGQKMTGVSLMLLVEKMDEGPLIGFGEQPLNGHETTPELTQKLINLSDALIQDLLPGYVENNKSMEQSTTGRQASYSRKLTKDDGIIDWTKSAEQIEREIRAFREWPKSRTNLGNKEVVITAAKVFDKSGPAGQVEISDKQLMVYAEEKALIIEKLKPVGKNEMSSEAFLAGYKQLLT